MNCHRAEQLVLLKDSGELGVVGRWRLDRHLAHCAPCRAHQDALLGLTEAVRAWDTGDVSAATRQRVLAQRPAADRRDVIALEPAIRPSWLPRLAYAAAALAVLAAGLWFALPRAGHEAAVAQSDPAPGIAATPAAVAQAGDSWDDGVDAELDALTDLLASSLHEGSGQAATGTDTADLDESDEDTLARELMQLQGYAI